MSQYNRMISYMYQYVAGEKGQNIGFARIEQRNGKCRVIIQMRTIELPSMPEVWFYKQSSTGIEYIVAGKISYYSGSLNCRIDTEMINVCGSGCDFRDIDGIIIYISDREFYATTWTKDSIFIGEIIKYGSKKQPAKEIESEKEEANINNNEVQTAEVGDSVENKDLEINYTDNKTTSDENDADNEETPVCENCPYNNLGDYGERIMKLFPIMYPFASGEIERSVRIGPKDIGCLPVTRWALSNNRFLLHGYYCYKHLIFAKMKNGGYAVGVPGIYNDKADSMAHEYSFGEFQAIGTEEKCQGVFGYWIYNL